MGGMNNSGFGRGGPGAQGGWNAPPSAPQSGFGGPGAFPPAGPSQQFGQSHHQGQQFGFQGHGMQGQQHPPTHMQQHMHHQQNQQYQNGNQQSGRNDSTASLTATGVEGVKMESPDTGTPEVVATPTEKKKNEKPKRETRMVYGDNEISPVSATLVPFLGWIEAYMVFVICRKKKGLCYRGTSIILLRNRLRLRLQNKGFYPKTTT